MEKFLAQPQFVANSVTIYNLSSGAVPLVFTANEAVTAVTAATADLPNAGGPNSVLVYQDFSGASSPKQCLIVAYIGPSNEKRAWRRKWAACSSSISMRSCKPAPGRCRRRRWRFH